MEASGGLAIDLLLSDAPQPPTTTLAHVQSPLAKPARPHAMDTSVAVVLKLVTPAVTQAHTQVPPCSPPCPPAPFAISLAIPVSVVLVEHGGGILNAYCHGLGICFCPRRLCWKIPTLLSQ